MPRSQANVHFDMFEGIDAATPLAKLLYVRLLAEKHMNQAGIGPIRLTKWARDCGLPVTHIMELMTELESKRFAFFDEYADEFLVRTLVRNDGVANIPNVLLNACKCARMLASVKLRRVLAEELRKLPPQPPDKVWVDNKTGTEKRYVYPDPHGTAAAIDPGPQPDDPLGPGEPAELSARGPARNGASVHPPASHPASHPAFDRIGAASHPGWDAAPTGDGCPEGGASAEDASHPGWERGGGGGGGGSAPVPENSLLESALRAPRAHTDTRVGAPVREAPAEPVDDPGATVIEIPPLLEVDGGYVDDGYVEPPAGRRRGRRVPDRRSPQQWNELARSTSAHQVVTAWAAAQEYEPVVSVVSRLAQQATPLLAAGWSAEDVTAALTYWSGKTVGAGAFQSVADEWRRLRHRPEQRKPTRVEVGMTSGQRAFAALRAQQGRTAEGG